MNIKLYKYYNQFIINTIYLSYYGLNANFFNIMLFQVMYSEMLYRKESE